MKIGLKILLVINFLFIGFCGYAANSTNKKRTRRKAKVEHEGGRGSIKYSRKRDESPENLPEEREKIRDKAREKIESGEVDEERRNRRVAIRQTRRMKTSSGSSTYIINYVDSIPCSNQVKIKNETYYNCDGLYYRSYYQGYKLVNVQVDDPN